ncbi:MAG: hypothetical protein GY810_11590 [Aureispira sp.]|nr:hypothetical protein [Aureispira sp.]
MSNSIILYELKTAELKVTITATLSDDGSLLVEGYDVGKTVKRLKGSIDYEYSLKVETTDLPQLLVALQLQDAKGLLAVLQERFNNNYAFSSLRSFLDEKGIEYSQFFWN